ncbi:hypothetical protein FA95DRAFT_1479305, partial [Auriscalpium vulgare]
NPTTPVLVDDIDWFTAYAVIHRLSDTSWRYAYLFWVIVAFVASIFAIFHSLGLRSGVLGAYWSKWSLRRRTWRKKHSLAKAKRSGQPHKQPISLPSNAQLLCLFSLILITFGLMFIGPDYISPEKKLWQFRRAVLPESFFPYQPHYTIPKAWWTSGGRAGLIAFALFPLCVLFVLKAPPFALFAISFFTNIHFDKLMWLHRWTGRFIWLVAAIHTAFWSIQLVNDRRVGTGRMAYVYAWKYPNFIYAWTAFGLLTLIILLSLRPIRNRFYESFYFLHIFLVPLMLIMSALHHPPVWWWCWAALMLWAGERIWRATRWMYTNGIMGSSTKPSPTVQRSGSKQAWEMVPTRAPDVEAASPGITKAHYPRGQQSEDRQSYGSPISPMKSPYHSSAPSASTDHFMLSPSLSPTYVPPTGYAHAELLAGRTVRLRFAPPGYLSWAPGQHFLLCVPSVSKLVSHPFTCASICDEQTMGDEGRTIVFLIRAKNGWTRDLWETIVNLIASDRKHPKHEVPEGTTLPAIGVLLRCWVDGPFGSSARAEWGAYSSVLIISGGSGVSFGLSVLEYLCMCMAGRNGKYLGGNTGWGKQTFLTQRVRFVCIVRDFAHLQWCATSLRRCAAFVSPDLLQIELFVTNFKPTMQYPFTPQSAVIESSASDALSPPHPRYMDEHRRREGQHTESDSEDSHDGGEADVDLSYYTGDYSGQGELGHEEHILDLTNFDGDNDDHMPGEASVNHKVKKEGTLRRAITRKALWRNKGKPDVDDRRSRPPASPVEPERPTPRISAAPKGHRFRQSNLSESDTVTLTADVYSPRHSHRASQASTQPDDHTHSGQFNVASPARPDWDTRSMISQASSMHALMPGIEHGAYGETVKLEVDEREMHDMHVVAEFARAGRPKLDVILRDEVSRAKGHVMVASCGPTALDAVVRKTIAAQIDPARIRRGDMSGSISLVAEEFSY